MISLAITLVGFLLMEYFFSYTVESGNGNFGFVGIILLLPFLLLSLFITIRYFIVVASDSSRRSVIIGILIGVIIFVGSIYFAIDNKNHIISTTGDVTFSMFTLTAEASRIYFNLYTFISLHTACGLIGAIIHLFSNKNKAETL